MPSRPRLGQTIVEKIIKQLIDNQKSLVAALEITKDIKEVCGLVITMSDTVLCPPPSSVNFTKQSL